MSTLSMRDRELVALGAALASNCIPCLEFHVPAARQAGLSDADIAEAIALADKIRKVPADKALDAAHAQLGAAPTVSGSACCAPSTTPGKACC